MWHCHFYKGFERRNEGQWHRHRRDGDERWVEPLRLPREGGLRGGTKRVNFLHQRGRVPEFQQLRRGNPATRVRYFWWHRRHPYPSTAQAVANADSYNTAYHRG